MALAVLFTCFSCAKREGVLDECDKEGGAKDNSGASKTDG